MFELIRPIIVVEEKNKYQPIAHVVLVTPPFGSVSYRKYSNYCAPFSEQSSLSSAEPNFAYRSADLVETKLMQLIA